MSKYLELKLLIFMLFSFLDPIYDPDGIWYANFGDFPDKLSIHTHITNSSEKYFDPRLLTQHYAFLAGSNTSDYTSGVAGFWGPGMGTICLGWGPSKFFKSLT